MPHRNPETDKTHYGHALLIGGAYGRMGCAILSARAALRSGCGLITVHLPARCVDPMQAAFPEAMVSIDPDPIHFTTLPPHLERYKAVAVGPGLGTSEASQAAFAQLLTTLEPQTRLVLDADALNILALRPDLLEPLGTRTVPAIVTPHLGEYTRLFGTADPADIARQHNIIVVKKSHRTHVYAPDGGLYVNQTGNAGMATAGSGDVLTGILLGMLAQQQWPPFETACLGVRLHGQCGDLALAHQTESSLIASDLVEMLRHIDIGS